MEYVIYVTYIIENSQNANQLSKRVFGCNCQDLL